MLAWLAISLGAAAPKVVPYQGAEWRSSAVPFDEVGTIKLGLGQSAWQTGPKVQVRSSLLGTPIAPNLSANLLIGQSEFTYTSVEPMVAALLPWFDVFGVFSGAMVHHSIASAYYQPSWLHLSGGLVFGGISSGGRGGGVLAPVGEVMWDHAIGSVSRVRVGGIALAGLATRGVVGLAACEVGYLHQIGAVRLGFGGVWSLPPDAVLGSQVAGALLPYPTINLYGLL